MMTTGYDRSNCPLPKKGIQSLIADALRDNWELAAFTDYKGATLMFRDVALKIARLHILFKETGIKPGDRVAICGRNSSSWAVACLAAMSYKAVVVPILHEFKPDNIHNIVNHSEARLLFAAKHIWDHLDPEAMTSVEGVLSLENFNTFLSRSKALDNVQENLDGLFSRQYPDGFTSDNVEFTDADPESLAMINYTSGSTGFSKGVMLPCRSLVNNRLLAARAMYSFQAGYEVLSILPMAHMYGFSFEFFYEFSVGCHIYFLTRLPSPKVIFQALGEIRPRLIVSVPLVIEKIIRKNVMPKLEKPSMKLLLKLPVVGGIIRRKIGRELVEAFGGRFFQVIIGGAAFSHEIEQFLASVHFPYTVGYGATECGPIITYQDKDSFVPGSCGVPAPNMEVKILSSDPQNIAGEIVCKGPNVMLGYYRNDELTAKTIDSDGWLHTGDLGVFDAQGNLFIKGRSKNMLLGPSGQNIYPEEIEDLLGNMYLVCESLVIQENDKLVALVFPDYDEARKQGLHEDGIAGIMEQNRRQLNSSLPAYEQIAEIRIRDEEFEKTPKKSIKRYLYQKQ